MPRFCTLNVNIFYKRKLFQEKKNKLNISRFPVEFMEDEDYTDSLALLTNTPAQVKSQLH